MSWFMASIYDRFMRPSEEACLSIWRKELLASVTGQVLEIGAGTGINLDHYPSKSCHISLLEPDPSMRRILRKRLKEKFPEQQFEISEDSAETLPYADDSFDFVVSTLVLCSVPDPVTALNEIHRVLKTTGQFIFIEHIAAPLDSTRYRWQRLLEPFWKPFAGGCHVTRQTEKSILESGFEISQVTRESMRKAAPIVRPSIRGSARKIVGELSGGDAAAR
jgi:ubiquinone/menaquinone biosynthesis C-methylase UbiE